MAIKEINEYTFKGNVSAVLKNKNSTVLSVQLDDDDAQKYKDVAELKIRQFKDDYYINIIILDKSKVDREQLKNEYTGVFHCIYKYKKLVLKEAILEHMFF